MAKVDVNVSVSKEAHELGVGIKGLVLAIKEALADGWDTTSDLPTIVTASLTHLAPAVQGVDQLDDEAKEDLGAFINALSVPTAEMTGELLKKKDQEPAPPAA